MLRPYTVLQISLLLTFFKKLKCYRFLSFEIVSYFDIRISNLVAAKGRAVPFVVKLFLVAAFAASSEEVFR